MERPDLVNINPDVIAYVEYLETRIAALEGKRSRPLTPAEDDRRSETALPQETASTDSLFTLSAAGKLKRTFRHLFSRQHRGGMGIFDLDVDPPDLPVAVQIIPEGASLLLFTNFARVFRLPASRFEAGDVRAKGEELAVRFPLEAGERFVALLQDRATGYVALGSQRGRVRVLRHHLFGEHMRPGTAMFRSDEFGELAAVCWTPGNADLLLLTRRGMGIRFAEKLLNPQGDLGIKLSDGDQLVATLSVDEDSQVFLAGADGRGTLRSMKSFAANKSAGGMGKLAMRTDQLTGGLVVNSADDIFMISRLSKLIRFPVNEVPETDGVVQGVACMQLRADEAAALSIGRGLS